MKITYNWLKEFVNFNLSPEELADRLTMTGLQVELIAPVKTFFSNVVVGKILEISPHPNAQKLQVTKVTVGGPEPLQIICGANNISVGDFVPTAVIGAVMADGMQITQRALRGVDSFGMLCSEKELGLGEGTGGILILSNENTNNKNLKLSTPIEEALDLNDIVLDINVTPNRPDALSILGLAREVSVITGNPVVMPKVNFTESEDATDKSINITIDSPLLCPRYTARIIKNVKVKPAPFWIRYRLNILGNRTVNNIVDCTNYVLLEFGQPLHAFDYNTIGNKKIFVRAARKGEKITSIDNETRELNEDMLIIADDSKPIAIAGVMGGKETEVNDNTKDILLESAFFNPQSIRRTSKKLGLSSESSYRFERTIDPEIQAVASDRAAQLIVASAGGIVSKGIIDCKVNPPKPPTIQLTADYCRRIIGLDIPEEEIASILRKLGCNIIDGKNEMSVIPPSSRPDVQKNIDLVEEIVRIYGYTKIEPALPEALIKPPAKQTTNELIKKSITALSGLGLNEVINYSFINPKDLELLKLSDIASPIRLANPIDQNMCVMRTTLIPGIVNNILHNLNMGNEHVEIFETGKCFFPNTIGTMPKEEYFLSIGISTGKEQENWRKTGHKKDFYYIEGILEDLLGKLKIQEFTFKKTQLPSFHPGKFCAILIGEKQIGFFGALHPQIVKSLGIKDPSREIYCAELNISSLIGLVSLRPKFRQLPKFPAVRRDISIVLDKNTESRDIINLVLGMGASLVEEIEVFDIYDRPPVPEGKKSIAYSITYRHNDRTLTDEEVDNLHSSISKKILEETGGEIRS